MYRGDHSGLCVWASAHLLPPLHRPVFCHSLHAESSTSLTYIALVRNQYSPNDDNGTCIPNSAPFAMRRILVGGIARSGAAWFARSETVAVSAR